MARSSVLLAAAALCCVMFRAPAVEAAQRVLVPDDYSKFARGVPTELVIYPGQYHLLTRPSFLVDRAERYISWYARFLQ